MKKLAIGMMVFCSLIGTSGVAWCADNGNGTVTVNGLVWLKDARCLGSMNWNAAMSRANALADGQCGLNDKSKPGDWRLPSKDELKAFSSSKSQFISAGNYWSSSAYEGNPILAW